jgi:hypothetical protein
LENAALTADKDEVQSFAALRESKCRCAVCSVCQPLLANELGRNNPKPVSVSVLDEAGHILATARAGHDAAID